MISSKQQVKREKEKATHDDMKSHLDLETHHVRLFYSSSSCFQQNRSIEIIDQHSHQYIGKKTVNNVISRRRCCCRWIIISIV